MIESRKECEIRKEGKMITKHLGYKIAILSLLILASGISASGQRNRSRDWDGYPNWGGSFDLRQTALNAAYNEGSQEGRNDRSHTRYHNYSDFSAYRNANKDYNSSNADR